VDEGRYESIGEAGQRDWTRVTVPDASRILGLTESTVRKRVQRGSIPHEKAENGRVYVYLPPDETRRESRNVPASHASRPRSVRPGQSRDSYVRSLEERVAFLEDQLRRQTDIIAGLVERVPELEAPPEPRRSPESAAAQPGGEPQPPAAGAQEGESGTEAPRSWWRRFFGFGA
jgi:hypothetical protein